MYNYLQKEGKNMKNENKREIIFLTCITIFFILYILIITKFGNYLYGSTIDWNCQHHKIPDYFRKLFYETKNIFPNFAFNLGSGQNIYNLSYYGLMSPVVLISYLFPFITMKTYLQISSVVLIWLSIVLLYKWLKTKFDFKVVVISTILFTLASPLLFHTHRHLMFVNYMPFLIMGLIAVDKYFENNKKSLLILSVFLITSTSYFFSIGAIVALVIYGVFVYINKNKKITFKEFIKDGIKFLFPIIIGILMSSTLLVPTFITLLSGRADGNTVVSLSQLLFPNRSVTSFLYHSYSLGVTSIVVFSLIYGIVNFKKEKRVLSIVLFLLITFPIFMYLLNGTLYINGKSLIPFLPLYMFLLTCFLKDVFSDEHKLKLPIILFIIFFIFEIVFNNNNYLFMFDCILTLVAILILKYKKQKNLLVISIIIISFVSFINCSREEKLVSKDFVTVSPEVEELVRYIQEVDKSFYRISDRDGGLYVANNVVNIDTYQTTIYSSLSNQEYREFYYDNLGNDILNRSNGQLSNPKNLLFNIYFGNKYIISNKNNNLMGYKMIKGLDSKAIYLNELSLPVGYSTDKLMSFYEYSNLSYPYNVEALMNYTIVNDNVNSNYETRIEKMNLDYQYTYYDLEIIDNNEYIEINSGEKGKINLELENDLSDKILFIRFDMLDSNPCSVGDNYISINGVLNKLTCRGWKYYNNNTSFEYTISEKNLNNLEISFAKGNYKITNIEVFTLDYNKFSNSINNYNSFNIDKNKTKGDVIEGNINSKEDGYFNLSIPYDKGFRIYLDRKEIDYEKVDVSFIGFEISKGLHNIKIVYEAPFQKVSKAISLIGIFMFFSTLFIEQNSFLNPKTAYKANIKK